MWVMLFHLLLSVHAVGDQFPALCATTTDLIIRTSASSTATQIATVPVNTYLEVKTIDDNYWAQIEFNGRTAYCSAHYLRYVGALSSESSAEDYIAPVESTVKKSDFWSWVIGIVGVSIILIVLKWVLLVLLGWLAVLFYKLYELISFPFYVLNWLQRFLAKPWRIFYKENSGSDKENEKKREILDLCKIPLYII